MSVFVFFILFLFTGCSSAKQQSFPLEIHVSESLANRNEIIQKVMDDLEPLHESGLPLKTVSLYVDDTGSSNKTTDQPGVSVCTEDQVSRGDYLDMLVLQYLDFDYSDLWKKYASYAYYCGEQPDVDLVRSFLTGESDKDVLSLFPGYFSTYYVEEDEIHLNKNVAEAYGAYIIDNYGVEELINCSAQDHMNDWLVFMGADYEFTDDYSDLLKQFRYTESSRYAMIVENDYNIKFLVLPSPCEGKTVFLLRQILCEAYEAVDHVLDLIEAKAPDYYSRAYDNLLTTNL